MSETITEEFPREAIFTYKGVKYYATRLDYLQSIVNNLTSLPILQEGEIAPFTTTSITSTLPIISETETIPSKEKRKKEKVKEHSKSSPKSVRTSTKSKTKSVKERKPLDKPYTKEQLEDLLRGTKISSPEVTTEGGLLTVRATIDLTENLIDEKTGTVNLPTRVTAGNIIFKVNPKTGNIRRVQTKASANDPNVLDEDVLSAIDKFREYKPIEKFFFTGESKVRSSTKQGETEKTKSKRDIIEVKKREKRTEEVIPEESSKINVLRERLEETKKREEAITESEESARVTLARERLMGSEIEDITPAKETKEVKESVIPPPKTSLTTSRSKLLGTTGGVLSKPLQSSTRKSTRVTSTPVSRVTTSLPPSTSLPVSIFEEEENIPIIQPTVAPNKPSKLSEVRKKIVEEIDEDEPKEDLSSSTSESSISKDVVVPSSESSSDDSSDSSSTEEV